MSDGSTTWRQRPAAMMDFLRRRCRGREGMAAACSGRSAVAITAAASLVVRDDG